eukprot:GHUV01037741.1.p1 GENE.GHUV01037741.1~~GHUV01037741.1.p1  ORF type:complete len:100 (-),score=14.73 GHUV01037741.1:776-1075(-)
MGITANHMITQSPHAMLVLMPPGTLDIMSTPEDVVEQQKRLAPNVLSAHFVYERYSHMDFVWDRNALYKADMVDLLYRFSPGTMSVPGKTITLPDKLMP